MIKFDSHRISTNVEVKEVSVWSGNAVSPCCLVFRKDQQFKWLSPGTGQSYRAASPGVGTVCGGTPCRLLLGAASEKTFKDFSHMLYLPPVDVSSRKYRPIAPSSTS